MNNRKIVPIHRRTADSDLQHLDPLAEAGLGNPERPLYAPLRKSPPMRRHQVTLTPLRILGAWVGFWIIGACIMALVAVGIWAGRK